MIKIAAVDDEMHALERFERIVREFKEVELCGLFETGEELLEYLKKYPLDSVLLDIEMIGINGLQLCEQILKINENIDIVFVTAFNEYAVEAFELQALDYIMKPLTEERLEKTINRLLKTKAKAKGQFKPYIQCIGDFQVSINGELMTFKNTKAKEVLAFLVHKKGVPVNWEKISEAVWPNYDLEKSQSNFHATTYLLRKKLKDEGISHILENGRGNYRIVPNEISCDIYQLEELIKENSIEKKEDYYLIKELSEKGYMDENGYSWAYSKAAQLDEISNKLLDNFKNK